MEKIKTRYEKILHEVKKHAEGFPESDYRMRYYGGDTALERAVTDLVKLIEASHNELLAEIRKAEHRASLSGLSCVPIGQ